MDILETNLGTYYNLEIYFHCNNIIDWCEEVFNTYKENDERGAYLYINNDLHQKLYAILSSAANISKMIKPDTRRNNRDTTGTLQRRRDRKKFYTNYFSSLNISEIRDNRLARNSLEHIDEYLDKKSVENPTIDMNNKKMSVYGMAQSDDSMFIPFIESGFEMLYIRCYKASTKTFYNFDQSINIETVYNEAIAIKEFLEENYQENLVNAGSGLAIGF